MASRYQPLADYLAAMPANVETVTLTLAAIAALIGEPLPAGAATALWWRKACPSAPARVVQAVGWRVTGHDFRIAVPTVTLTRAAAAGEPAAGSA